MKNYNYDEQLKIWTRAGFKGIAYSDGTEVEDRILKVISEASDLSVLSDELTPGITDWSSEYHLSCMRHCLIRPLNIQPGDKVLELGCGCGAITRYLGEIGADVVAVEGGAMRARIAAQRCRGLDNVSVILDDLLYFEDDQEYDWVLLVGVLEYAPVFSSAKDPIQHYLKRAAGALSQNGRLVVAIENQLGLKYLNGCGEDHVGIPYFGVNDLYGEKTPVTFGKLQLTEKIRGSGLDNIHSFFPYPDYKLPNVIVHESAFLDKDLKVSELIMRNEARDYSGSISRAFVEPLAAKLFEQNGILDHVSNSFMVVASKSRSLGLAHSPEIAWVYSCNNRKKDFCIETVFYRNPDNDLLVDKRRLDGKKRIHEVREGGLVLRHRCELASFQLGSSLFWQILKAKISSESMEDIADAFSLWFKEIKRHAVVVAAQPPEKLNSLCIEGEFIDALPFNYVMDKGAPQLIDKEWIIDGLIPLGWVLLRAVVWCLSNVSVGIQKFSTSLNVCEIMLLICKKHALSFDRSNLKVWEDLEINFQKLITTLDNIEIPNYIQRSDNVFSRAKYLEGKLESERISACEKIGHRDVRIKELEELMVALDDAKIPIRIAHKKEKPVAIYASTSWGFTKPFRCLGNMMRDSLIKKLRKRLAIERTSADGRINSYNTRIKDLEDQLIAECVNACEQIEYRDALVKDIEKKLEEERTNAREQIEHRDTLVKDIEKKLEEEHTNAREQIEHRDTLVKILEEKLGIERTNPRRNLAKRAVALMFRRYG